MLREIGRKVLEIQNEGLGEERIRELNDDINKLIREKGHWERRIVELGGPDFTRKGVAIEGEDMPRGRGQYRYFGAAKNLPGVKELLEAHVPKRGKRTRKEMYKNVDMDYFGLRDDEDGVLEQLEIAAEENLRAREIDRWMCEHPGREAEGGQRADAELEEVTGLPAGFIPFSMLPDDEVMERLVLEKKKEELLAKYASAPV